MKQIYYHGTSADNLQSILKHGLKPDTEKLWGCSRQEVYLWGVEELAIAENAEQDLQEWKEQAARNRAIESGRIACSIAKDCRIVLIKMLLDPKKVQEDTSCNYMGGAMCIDKVTKSQILEIEISNDIALLKGFIIAGLQEMYLWGRQWTDVELRIAKKLQNVEWYPEDYDDVIVWSTVEQAIATTKRS